MSEKLITLEQCLFNAFAWSDEYPPQDEPQLWGIIEGYERLSNHYSSILLSIVEAHKEHTCVHGCNIKPGDTYFQYQYSSSITSYIKICASCIAMLLYFYRVKSLEPIEHTHWDVEAQKPVLIGERKPNKSEQDRSAGNRGRFRRKEE